MWNYHQMHSMNNMSSSHWEDFYATHLPPSDFEDNRSLLREFCERHNAEQTPIVLVTVRVYKNPSNKILENRGMSVLPPLPHSSSG